jgi:ribosomal protein S6--L-glutamate ligase
VKIAFLVAKHPPEKRSPIMPEVFALLARRGAEVTLIHPDEELFDLAGVRPEHDLYVLKSGSETALSLAGALHHQGAAILNPYPAAAALRDKVVSTRMLQAAGAPVPETWVAPRPALFAPLLAGGPLIVKPYRGTQGRGVRVVRAEAELGEAGTGGDEALFFAQRFHAPDEADLKIYCVGGRAYGVKRVWPPRTYEDKLGQPFEVSPELAAIALRCGQAFGVDLFGVDVVMSAGKPYVVDMQTFPGFKGVVDAPRLLADAIEAAARGATAARGRTPPP